jgi:putative addiction module killer protein
MLALEEFLGVSGKSAYRRWFDDLDVAAATKVTVALERMAAGNTSSLKALGDGVSECKVDYGPGYRIYFGKDGEQLVILLGGGTKKKQSVDIENAKALWREYKLLKKELLKDAEIKTRAAAACKTAKKRR